VLARLLDGSRLHEFKALYGRTLVTGCATMKNAFACNGSPGRQLIVMSDGRREQTSEY